MKDTSTVGLPGYATPTGAFVEEWLEDHDVEAAELARRLGVSRKHLGDLMRARVALTPEMAVKLARVTGVPAETWSRLEALYRDDLARIGDPSRVAEEHKRSSGS